ncbi:MAG: hypothetical protein GY820_38405 [Gammaproteobacteria bacterium]|nr:hypothetical protein [Gammaproteobacteria bacterium]
MAGIAFPFTPVSIFNERDVAYIKGDEDTNGSLRLQPDLEHAQTGVQFELRQEGVWNVTNIDLIGEKSVALGHACEFGLAGAHCEMSEANGNKALLPSRHFTDATGSADADESVLLSPIINESTIQPDDSGLLAATDASISWEFEMGLEKLIYSVWIKPSIAFDSNVEILLRKGSSTGGILHRRNYPASQFVAGVSVEFTIPGMFEIDNFETIWFEIIPEGGIGTISLEADVTNLIPWLALTYYEQERVPLMNFQSGVDAIIYEGVVVGTGNNAFKIYPAIMTSKTDFDTGGNQITVVPTTKV